MHFFKRKSQADSYEYEVNRMEAVKQAQDNHYFSTKQLQDFIFKCIPHDIYQRIDRAEPFFYGSILSWPLFWSYRGLKWIDFRNKRTERLYFYIRKTRLQARILQFGLLSMGLLVAVGDPVQWQESLANASDNDNIFDDYPF